MSVYLYTTKLLDLESKLNLLMLIKSLANDLCHLQMSSKGNGIIFLSFFGPTFGPNLISFFAHFFFFLPYLMPNVLPQRICVIVVSHKMLNQTRTTQILTKECSEKKLTIFNPMFYIIKSLIFNQSFSGVLLIHIFVENHQ